MSNRILLALDGSPTDEAALAQARRIGVGGAEIHLLHAVPSRAVPVGAPLMGMVGAPEIHPVPVGAAGAEAHFEGSFPASLRGHKRAGESAMYDQALRYLEDFRRRLPGVHGQEIVRTGDPAEAILEAALTFNIDLIVMSTHARTALGEWLFGSVSRTVLLRSKLPVLLVRRGIPPPSRELRRVLVASDGSEASLSILPTMKALAARTGAEIILLLVANRSADVLVAARRFGDDTSVAFRMVVAEGRWSKQILLRARMEDVDVIAQSLGGRKRRSWISRATLPVLLQDTA